MRLSSLLSLCVLGVIAGPALAATGKTASKEGAEAAPSQIEVTADQSLEWYQDAHIYVARGNAKAIRGDMEVEADILTAHERSPPPGTASGDKAGKLKTPNANGTDPKATDTNVINSGGSQPGGPQSAGTKSAGTKSGATAVGAKSEAGDLDKITADGNVRITDPRERILGDHAVDDLERHVAIVTGTNLKYETEKDTVTARDSLEYWEDKRIAVARGRAVAVTGDRHVEADVLTAEFRTAPSGDQELSKMTATGHVVVITKNDVSRGDRAVYDINRNIAVLTGNVRISRGDGTELTGDVGEVDFKTNQSRLMNEGHGRVRALLPSKTAGKTGDTKESPAASSRPRAGL
ncbi:MAG: hypothetical protein M3N08_05820 [Pseudomonadota bacterium]|nr:hypothetical protein [Pseudomonadota bacterium]